MRAPQSSSSRIEHQSALRPDASAFLEGFFLPWDGRTKDLALPAGAQSVTVFIDEETPWALLLHKWKSS